MPDFVLGKDCLLFRNAGIFAVPVWTAVTVARDVTLTAGAGEWDAATRGSGGYKQSAKTMRDVSVDGELLFRPGDAGYGAMRDAFYGNGGIDLAVATGPMATPGTEVFRAEMDVFQFDRNEPLDGGLTIKFKAKPRPSSNAPYYAVIA